MINNIKIETLAMAMRRDFFLLINIIMICLSARKFRYGGCSSQLLENHRHTNRKIK